MPRIGRGQAPHWQLGWADRSGVQIRAFTRRRIAGVDSHDGHAVIGWKLGGILSLEEGRHSDEGLEVGDHPLGQALGQSRAARSRAHSIASWSTFSCERWTAAGLRKGERRIRRRNY